MIAVENKVYNVNSSTSVGSTNNLVQTSEGSKPAALSTDLSIEKIQDVFLQVYRDEISKFNPKEKNTAESHMIQRSIAGFSRSKCLPLINKTSFDIKFMINLCPEDKKTYRKTHLEEIGLFNFAFTVFKKSEGTPFKISYFSEIKLEEKFQAYGLASVIISTYTKTLQRLEANIDYLHVKSQGKSTAAMYKKKNYAITPSTIELLKTKYNGVEKYLEDSSVSYDESDIIEMYRAIDGRSVVANSVTELENNLGNS